MLGRRELPGAEAGGTGAAAGGGGAQAGAPREQVVVVRGTAKADEHFRHRDQGGRLTTHTDGGERQRYFDDDDRDLSTVIKQERLKGGVGDFDRLLADNIMRNSRFQNDADEDEYGEGAGEIYAQGGGGSRRRGGAEKERERMRHRAMAAHTREKRLVDDCRQCLSHARAARHLIVAMGQFSYLSLPTNAPLVAHHCLITPFEHCRSTLLLDENAWQDVRNFKKCLVRMFDQRGMDVIFMETVMSITTNRHTSIECIPVPRHVAAEAPGWFKQGLLTSDEEWAQHHKIIDTRGKDVRRCIPDNFAFFHVDFNLEGGYAHVIEDTAQFKVTFGRGIIAGMLDLEPRLYLNPAREDHAAQRLRVVDFKPLYEPFDWTAQLRNSQ